MWEITFDSSKFDVGIAKMEKFSSEFEKAIDDGLLEFLERLEKKYFELAALHGVPKSIVGKVDFNFTESGIIATFGGEVTLFFEYGTGIRGASSPHPKSIVEGWIYDVNQHGEKGWWYPTTESDPNPYKYVDKQGVLRAWTKGKYSKPFVYETWLWGTRSIYPIMRKHIRGIKI